MYINENVNPKKKKVGDCSTRALTKAIGIPYEQALKEQYEAAASSLYGITDVEVMDIVLKNHGFEKVKVKIKKGDKRPTPKSISEMTCGIYKAAVCHVSCHFVACTNGNVYDIWDSSDKCCYGYWVKK